VKVELDELQGRIREYGSVAFLTTVGQHGPHIVSVEVAWADGAVQAQVGATTAANADARPEVSLLWPAPPGQAYALILDGRAAVASGDDARPATVILRPERAVLHRLAGASGDGPGCITVLNRP